MKTRCQIPEVGIAPANGHTLEPDVIVDGAMNGGTWCYMCCPCHALFGIGLGVGRGQRFDQVKEGDEWRLVKSRNQI
jgi:hypothetical protein